FITVLNSARQQYRESLDAGTLALVDHAIDELANSGVIAQSLQVGDQVSNFALSNTAGQTIEFYQRLAQGSVVVSFFRGMWCPFCNLELQGLEQAFPAIQSLGATLMAISPQKQRYSLATVERHNLTFDVLNDGGQSGCSSIWNCASTSRILTTCV
ncbi:MAG: redoxin domain-containing protein, partial [Phormidesmis sp. CAN_BIN36]|nr:redoxin domain-containing protein [Phormidesmis sp. CAN_BIN36]